ncbi:Cell division coordinator CpoB [Candidatus Lokiarchaeum ossiferum]|uniref:Cell division coordinator CpoB n=1 Tax=Candidatus Lokiarchaeum ossiferum TaxID=2951803 RepID=A0ABY6HKV9_9ARCH|nr:Cell division coordinator CpoB [Candidatus Lokiarchaeum sp. B-35]
MSHKTYTKLEAMLKELVQLITSENFTYETNYYAQILFIHEISVSLKNQSSLGKSIEGKIKSILDYLLQNKIEEIPQDLLDEEKIQILKLGINKFLNINNFNAADKGLQLLGNIKSENKFAIIYQTRLLCNQNKFKDARVKLNQIQIPNKKTEKYLFFSTKFNILVQKSNIEEWKNFEKQIKEYIPDDVSLARMTSIQIYKLEGEFEKAISLQQEVINELKAHEDTHSFVYSAEYNTLGLIYLYARKFENAIQSFKTSIEYNPTSLNLKFQLGNAYESRRDYQRAIKIYTEILQIDPSNPKVVTTLANMISRDGNPDNAIKMYRKLMDNKSYVEQNGYFFKNLALAYFRKGDFKNAEINHNIAIEKDPNNHQFYYHRGTFYLHSMKYNKSKHDLLKAIELFPSHPDYWNQIGNVYLNQNLVEDATTAFQECVKLDPIHFSALFNLGLVHYFQKKPSIALKFLQKAEKSCPSQFLVYFYQGVIHLKNIQYKKASKCFLIALKLEKPTKLMQERFEKFELDILCGLYHCHFELQQNEEALTIGQTLMKKTEKNIESNEIFVSNIESVQDPTSFLLIIKRNYAVLLERIGKYEEAIEILSDHRPSNSFLFDENHKERCFQLTSIMYLHKKEYINARNAIWHALSNRESSLSYFICGFIEFKLKTQDSQKNFKVSVQILYESQVNLFLYFENLKILFEFCEKFHFTSSFKKISAFQPSFAQLTQKTSSIEQFNIIPYQLWYKIIMFSICIDSTQEFMIEKLEELNERSQSKFSEWLDYWEMLLHLGIKYKKTQKIKRVLKKMFALNPNYKIRSKLWNNEIIGKQEVLKLKLSEKIKQQKQVDLTEERYVFKFRDRGFWHKGDYYIILDTGETGSEFREGPNNYYIKDQVDLGLSSKRMGLNTNDNINEEEKQKFQELMENLHTQVFLTDKTETNFQSNLTELFGMNNSGTMNYFLSKDDIQAIKEYNEIIKKSPEYLKQYGIIQYGDIIGYFLQHIEEDKKGNHSLLWIKGTSGNIGRISETYLELVGLYLLESEIFEMVDSPAQGRLLRTFTAESRSYEPFFTLAGKKLEEPLTKIPFVYNNKKSHNKPEMLYLDYLIPTQLIQFCNPEQGSILADRRGRVKRKILQEWHILDENSQITLITKVLINALRSFFFVQLGKSNPDLISEFEVRFSISEMIYLSQHHKKNYSNIPVLSKILTSPKQLAFLIRKFAKKTKEGNMVIVEDSGLSEIADKVEIWQYANPGIIDYSDNLPKCKFETIIKEIYHPLQHPFTLIDGEIGCGKSVLLAQIAINQLEQNKTIYILQPFVELSRVPDIKPNSLIIIDNIDALSDHQLQIINLWYNIKEIQVIATIRSEKMKAFRNRFNILNPLPNSLSRWHSVKFSNWTIKELIELIEHEKNYWGIASGIENYREEILEISNGNCTFSTGILKNLRFKGKKVLLRSDLFEPVEAMGSKILRLLAELYLDENSQIISENATNELKLIWIILMAYRKIPIEQIEPKINYYRGLPDILFKSLLDNLHVDLQSDDSYLSSIFPAILRGNSIKIPPNIAWKQYILDIKNGGLILFMRNKQGNSSFFELERWAQILKIFQNIQEEQGESIFQLFKNIIQEIVNSNDFDFHELIHIICFTIGFYYDRGFYEYFPSEFWESKNYQEMFKSFNNGEMIEFIQIILSTILYSYMPISLEIPQEVIFKPLKIVESIISYAETDLKILVPNLIKTQLYGFQGKFHFYFQNIEESLTSFLKVESLPQFSEMDLEIQMEILEEIISIYLIQKKPEIMEAWLTKIKDVDQKMCNNLNRFPKILQPHVHELHASYLFILSRYYEIRGDTEKKDELFMEANIYKKEWNIGK